MNSYTSENILMVQKAKCENYERTTIWISSKSHLDWKNQFHKKPLYFRITADFEADVEIFNSSIGNKTTNIYKQNPVLNGYHIISERDGVL